MAYGWEQPSNKINRQTRRGVIEEAKVIAFSMRYFCACQGPVTAGGRLWGAWNAVAKALGDPLT
ncbi:hypothetical protein [Maritimibacter alkaliphilus]|uniref:hypothetical protein n=1 Tax=Maritimibacter alkaliphilus TaxID=404236 RepID=UPI00137546D8|nr:hypothetical protein [Maritimibacter alkaliphilus]